jgi:hypothetical protein
MLMHLFENDNNEEYYHLRLTKKETEGKLGKKKKEN